MYHFHVKLEAFHVKLDTSGKPDAFEIKLSGFQIRTQSQRLSD